MSDIFARRPPPVTLANLETAEILELQFIPAAMSEELEAEYNRAKVIGFSSRPLQYGGTENVKHSSLPLNFDARFAGGSLERTKQARQFILSLLFAMRGSTVASAGTPRVQLVFPRIASYTGKITGVKIDWELQHDGQLIAINAVAKFESDAQSRLYSDDVRKKGLWF